MERRLASELELSKKNIASLSKALDKYWNTEPAHLRQWAADPPPEPDHVDVSFRQDQSVRRSATPR